jgi:DNA-directed RNA polymerase subunit RPC12/RpoP
LKTASLNPGDTINCLSRHVELEVEGWEGIVVHPDEKGEPIAEETGDRDVDLFDWGDAFVLHYRCVECNKTSLRLKDAVSVKPEAECRDCGFAGPPDEHPETCPGELLGAEPPAIHPNQAVLV